MRNQLLFTCLALCAPTLLWAAADDNATLQRGEIVYKESCATGYCHGIDGSMAGAPRLVARGFDVAFIKSVVSEGVAGTTMQGFAAALPGEDLLAVMTYVAALNDIRNPVFFPAGGLGVAAATERPVLSAEGELGRALFIAADKGAQRCSTCHELEGLGIPVAGPITQVPASVAALRELQTPQVHTITAAGSSMPGLMVANGVAGVLFYDLTTVPPVLRTLPAGMPAQTAESDWSHTEFMRAYSEEELQSVLSYLSGIAP